MRIQLKHSDLEVENKVHLHFALGKALEDYGKYADSFEHYLAGNELRRIRSGYDSNETTAHLRRNELLLTREFFLQRRGFGAEVADPIFIVGLPRSGSTLVEQILASHSQVEGTRELPNISAISELLHGRGGSALESPYPTGLATLGSRECRAFGDQYIEETQIHRKAGAPFFIDKMPNNFAFVGLIQLILPNSKIIDTRRHPLACCFSAFKQLFTYGQSFTYGLRDIGLYFRDYVELMAHFDYVLPGRVHRVNYESMVNNTEGEVRRLLDYCGLPFEDSCLQFYHNDRAVRTASAQQVRLPIFREALDHWRHYDNWLGALKAALGPVLDSYPEVPAFQPY